MKFYSILLFCLSLNFTWGQLPPVGQWRMHIANKGIAMAASETQVMVALETGVLEYDIVAKETSHWTDVNSLSDINVSTIYFDEIEKAFYIGYKNGNIDKILNNQVINIPAIKLASLQGDKKVNEFQRFNDKIYIANGLGIVVLNPLNNEIIETYYPFTNGDVVAVEFHHDSIFALSSSYLKKASINNPILADEANWYNDNRVPLLTQDSIFYSNLETFGGKFYLLKQHLAYGKDTIFEIANDLLPSFSFPFTAEIESMKKNNGSMFITLEDGFFEFDENQNPKFSYNLYPNFSLINNKSALKIKEDYYVCDYSWGLFKVDNYFNLTNLQATGPPHNRFFALGGYKDKIGVAAGSIAKTVFYYYGEGAYVFENEEWSNVNRFNQELLTDKNLFDVSGISFSPKKNNTYAFSSQSEVPLVVVEDGTATKYFDESNSGLKKNVVGNGLTCISDIEYDSDGNLWMINCNTTNPLKVYSKDELWYDFSTGSSTQNKFSGRMVIDQDGNKWFSIQDEGLIGFNHGDNLEDKSDDKYKQLKTGELNGDLPEQNITALAVDQDNELWIGTSSGFAVLYNPSGVFEAEPGDFNVQRLKIDLGTYVEYVLGKTSITDIEVDGGNRKWMGTASAGIFLLSPDGYEVLASYTKENSPLISNNIVDMQFNGKTGELFVITDIGMVSLRTDASDGDVNYEDVIVFPNPVENDFNGWISIQGISADSEVAFTDISGNLIFRTSSNGGTATWNGKNFANEKVAPGVYLIWTSYNNGKGRKVGKVVILD